MKGGRYAGDRKTMAQVVTNKQKSRQNNPKKKKQNPKKEDGCIS